jgi:hypothetical protein
MLDRSMTAVSTPALVDCGLISRTLSSLGPTIRDDVPMNGPTPLRAPRIRRAAIPDDAVVVVRGDDLDPGTSREQARSFLRRFPDWGRYGLSAYYARDDAEVDDLAGDQLERFPALAVFELAPLMDAGFELVPTFRTPHVTGGLLWRPRRTPARVGTASPRDRQEPVS